ncbi:hypothetical protein B566_EDAN013732 [Ephemera danica]|nr:hypothetical protein B566_EDAN013732 [Ephemera danica]
MHCSIMSALRNVRNICRAFSPWEHRLKGKKWEISPYLKQGPCYGWSVIPEGPLEKCASRKSFISDLSVKKRIDFNFISMFNEEETPDFKKVYSLTTPNRNILLYKGVSPPDNWDILGKGGYGVVIRASYKGQDVAVKVVQLFFEKQGVSLRGHGKQSLQREHNALQLNHPHVLPVLLVEQGPKFMEQICLGVEYCHQNGIVHLDLKPINILLDCYGSCKITDFGNSAMMNAFGKFGTSLGTVIYSAPELFESKTPKLTTKCDIYSLGIMMWQLLSKTIPYGAIKDINTIIYQVVKHNLRPESLKLPRVASVDFRNWIIDYHVLFRKCWVKNPEHRPNINQVLVEIKKLQQFETKNGFNFFF